MNKEQNEIKMESKALRIKLKSTDDTQGIVEAIVSVYGNVDSYDEVVEKGAFAESLQAKLPKGVWMHNWDQPIAKTLEANETDEGLYIKGQFNLETQRGKEAYSDLKFGIVDEFSIGYQVLEDSVDLDGVRHLKKLKLFEWSPVLVGANPKTRVIDVKSQKDVDTEDGETEKEPETTEQDDNQESVQGSQNSEAQNDDMTNENEKDDTEQGENTETDDEKAQESEVNEKEGRVLSGKSRELIQTVVDQMAELKGALNNAISPLKELLDATEKGVKVDAEAQQTDRKTVLRIRQQAKQVDKAIEKILKITK